MRLGTILTWATIAGLAAAAWTLITAPEPERPESRPVPRQPAIWDEIEAAVNDADLVRALALAQRWTEQQPLDPRSWRELGRRHAALGDDAAARRAWEEALAVQRASVDRSPDARGWYGLARTLALLDRRDEAFEALSKAADAGWANSAFTSQRDQDLARLRDDARFPPLIERIMANESRTEVRGGI